MGRPDKNSVALAGEFAVLSQLALWGLNPSMMLGHTKGVDILVSNPKTKKMCRVEVKTKYRDSHKQGHNSKMFGHVIGGWMMSKEDENVFDPDLFYCFVMYAVRETKKEKFRFFVVPNKVVTAYLRNEHQRWRRAKRKKGKKTGIRLFRLGFEGEKYPLATPLVEEYENRWELVGAVKNGA